MISMSQRVSVSLVWLHVGCGGLVDQNDNPKTGPSNTDHPTAQSGGEGGEGEAGAGTTTIVAGTGGSISAGGDGGAAGGDGGAAGGDGGASNTCDNLVGGFRFDARTALPQDPSGDVREGDWDCTLRAQEFEGTMMRLYFDCSDGDELVPSENSFVDLEFSGVKAPKFKAFTNGMALRYEFRVSMNPWIEDQWARLSANDGSVLFEGYLWWGSPELAAKEPLEVTFEEGPCPKYQTDAGRNGQLTVPMTAHATLSGVEATFTRPGMQRLGDYSFYVGDLHAFEYPEPDGMPKDAVRGEFCLGYVKDPQ